MIQAAMIHAAIVHAALLIVSALMAGYSVWLLGSYAVAMGRARSWRKRNLASAAVQPKIREALVDFLSGNNDLAVLRSAVKANRNDVCDVVFGFSRTVAGGARDRLCELTLELGLVHEWVEDTRSRDAVRRRTAFERLAFVSIFEPCRRVIGERMREALRDADPEVRLSAVSAVTRSGIIEQVEEVFEMAVSKGLLARILFAEHLRPHVYLLCATSVAKALKSEDPTRMAAVLETVLACERALPIEGMAALMHHRDRTVRLDALRLAPLVAAIPENQHALLECLAEADPEVVTMAARSVGKLRLKQGLHLLARVLRRGENGPARAAAAAIAEMPPLGWKTLEELCGNSNPATAAAAAEALERARSKAGVQ
jgi:hypothetical protein